MIPEVIVVKSIRDFLINDKEYMVWVDSKLAAEVHGLEPTHQLRICGKVPDILARKGRTLVAIECKGERESGRQIIEAIGQVVYYKKGSHKQYIGCPESLVDDTVYDICNHLNVGLLTVNEKQEVNEELKPSETLLDNEILDAILELMSPNVDIKPIPNISFSRPEPFIIATLVAYNADSYIEMLHSLMKILPSKRGVGCSEKFAKKVVDAAISLRLVQKRGNSIFLTRDGSLIVSYFLDKCKNIEKAINEVCAIYKPKIYGRAIHITEADVKLVAKYSLLKHPTIDFLTSMLIEMREEYGRSTFTFKEILEFAKNKYPEKTMLYLAKASSEKESAEDLDFEDIDTRICDDIKAQMRNAGIIRGKQKAKVDPADLWEICI